MNWEKVKLGDISLCIQPGPFGSQLHSSDYAKEGTPIVMPKDMIDGRIMHNDLICVPEEHKDRLKRHQVFEGDLLVARKGDVQKCVYIQKEENGWLTGSDCLKVSLDKSKCHPKFVFYQLRSSYIGKWLETLSIGATMPSLNTGLLSSIPLMVPSITDQKKIAYSLSVYDYLIENNQKQIKLLEEAAQRLYKEWFVDLHFLGYEKSKIIEGVPEGWKRGILGDIAVDSGKIEKKESRSKYNYYLPIDCMPKNSITYTETNSIELAESSLVAFKANDILFGAMRPYFHKVVVARDKGLTRTTCFVIEAKKSYMWAYLTMLLFSKKTISYATSISVGTTMPYVRWKDFVNMPVLIPTEKNATAFQEVFMPFMNAISSRAKQIVALTEARNRLLPKLMGGEIEV